MCFQPREGPSRGLLRDCGTDGSSAALIEVLTVETEHAGVVFPGSKRDIRQYLADRGYVHVYSLGGGC